MHFNAKNFFLVGFILLLLVGIPIAVYLVQQQQVIKQRAQAATNLSFNPDSSSSTPITKNVGDNIAVDVMVDPGTNLVSFLTLEIQYDPEKLATASANAFQVNSALFPTVTDGPNYSNGKITIAMSIGTDLTKAITTKSRAATINFTALNTTTTDTPTLVKFGINTLVNSGGPESQASENVLASTTPATIMINAAGGVTPPPTTPPVTTLTPAASPTTPITPGATGTGPSCTSLTADTASGNAPLTANLTANGTSAANTISKVTFNFGDGQVSDVTTGGGIGTGTVNVPLGHTYSTAGTFQASAIFTDSAGNVSTGGCTQTITVGGGSGTSGGGAGGTGAPTPTLAATGSTSAVIGAGAATLLMVGGGLLFFLL
ncbi:MAG TPA: hypothetical protein VF810_03135 [Patescibacteria group bacterium]